MKKLLGICLLCLLLSGSCMAIMQGTIVKPTDQTPFPIIEKPKTWPKCIDTSKILEIHQGVAFLKSMMAG